MLPDVKLYTASFLALWLVLFTMLIQGLIAGGTKARLPGAIPGKIDPALGHESFVFRAHRTFQNSLENFPLFIGAAMLALRIGTPPAWTAVFMWTYALARIAHSALFYAIATDTNPSPRSYFYIIGLAANVGLLSLSLLTLI